MLNRKYPMSLRIFLLLIMMLFTLTALSGCATVSAGKQLDQAEAGQKAEIEEALSKDTIYDNIYIEEVAVGGLSKDKAAEKLKNTLLEPLKSKEILLTNGEDKYVFSYGELGIEYDLNAAVETAWNYARTGADTDRYKKITELSEQAYKISADYRINESIVKGRIASLAEELYIKPVNASMSRENGKFQITAGADGKRVKTDTITNQIIKALKNREEITLALEFETEEPHYTVSDLSEAQSLLGSYSTSFTAGNNGRNTNMRVATEKINNTVLYPDEIFSTNEAFGPTTPENGYMLAGVIEGGVLTDGYGGGVCQVSSTLYNALLYSELEIVERRNHSLKVGYLDYGFDATLAGDYIDLKFRNDSEYPVFIEAYIEGGNKVVANIYGKETRSSNRKLVFTNSLLGTTAPGEEEIIEDSNLPAGEREVVISALNGRKYEVYKTVYENNVQVDHVLVNTSTYNARRGQVKVGTGPPAPEEQQTASEEHQTVAEETPAIDNSAPSEQAEDPTPTEETPDIPITVEPAFTYTPGEGADEDLGPIIE